MQGPIQLPHLLGIDHVGMAVHSGHLEEQILLYRTLGFTEVHREDIRGSDLVREVLLRAPGGKPDIQLLEPLHASSPVARQMEKNGGRGGIAHLAFQVEDIHEAFRFMQANDFQIIDAAPRRGSRGSQVFFVHPKTSSHVALEFLLEVVQHVGGAAA